MTVTRVLPDIEAAVRSYLLTTEVADLVDDRIYAETPEGVAYPFLQVLKVSEQDERHWIALATIQLAGVASRANVSARATARDVCETAVAVLHDAENQVHEGAVLGRCSVSLGPRPLYDPPTGNPRFVADVFVPYHPGPEVS